MRFGIDLDGVLGDFSGRVIEAANSVWPGKIRPDFVPDNWDYEGTLTKEEWVQVWARIKTTPHFWLREDALPGLEELSDSLYLPGNREDEVFFITARAATVGESPLVQSTRWLQAYGLWPRGGRSVVIPVADPKHKQDLFRGLKLQFMLDDYAPTVEQLNQIEDMHAFVLHQPWNRYATTLPRVFSVTEYLDQIRAIDATKIPVS